MEAFQILFTRFLLASIFSSERLRSWPGVVPVARVNRRASVPYSSITVSGSITFPSVLDIFLPFSSLIRP